MSYPVALLTGFEPFGGAASNPSWDAVERLSQIWRGPAQLHIARLPVAFADSAERLETMIALLRPDIVIATGLAQGRAAMTPELIAINRIDARISDNDGVRPQDVPVLADAPDGLFSTLPVKAMVAGMRAAGVPATLSYSAGTFVCNSTFFALMNQLRRQGGKAIGGFVHVPATPSEDDTGACPTMSVDMIALGLEAALMACLERRHEPVETGVIA